MRIELILEDPNLSVAEEFAIARALHRKRKALLTEGKTRYQRKQQAKGLCVACPRKARPGRKHCAEHGAYYLAYTKRWKAERKVRVA